ncbi:DUF4304 domain-containing protein [Nocardioides sp. CER19]|uniref:DUF4304 domain-containing protein n=1 Tax=Nocardioides sp. CER19 TaxID=3038538 RepID=UPI00244A7C66|nr:DUF4304 domain-containing protein [Nocardioides sp. CER19]MDH2415261.1 DUF4304 domain-containing protein [Nocardioides sp. CER19]
MRFRRRSTSTSPVIEAHGAPTVQAALKAALRDVVGPAAREHGFKGSVPNWRRNTDLGDWAIVNVQTSQYSSRESLRCVVNLSLAPQPWLAWTEARQGPLPKSLGESYGLYRERLHPSGSPAGVYAWWEVNDPDDAPDVAADIQCQLEQVGWPTLERLLDRTAMVEQVRAGDLGFAKREFHGVFFARAEAVLLSDYGPSAELDEQLSYALEHVIDSQRAHAMEFDDWVRKRAASASS